MPTRAPAAPRTCRTTRRSRASALGPALNEQGYYVGRVERNLYWVTDGTYQSAFLTTSDGVVLLDAPPTIGHNIQRAVDEIAAANGVSNKVTHLIYSHHHADHAGASSLFDRNVARIGHEETRQLLLRDDDPARPAPEETFQDRRTLEIGGERIELAWHGSNHSPDNIYIHLPDHDTLMLVDIVNPGWAPVYLSNLTEDIPGYIEAPANALAYPWKHFIGGHLGRLGTRDDVALHQQYMADIAASVRTAIDTVDPTPYFVEVRRERLGGGAGLSRRDDGRRRGAGHREVHRRARGRRRVHRQHHVLGHGVDPPRPRLRLAGASRELSADEVRVTGWRSAMLVDDPHASCALAPATPRGRRRSSPEDDPAPSSAWPARAPTRPTSSRGTRVGSTPVFDNLEHVRGHRCTSTARAPSRSTAIARRGRRTAWPTTSIPTRASAS